IIGLDSINTNSYSCSAKALERTSVYEIPLDKLASLATQIPTLQHHFFQLISRAIQETRQLSMLLSKHTAEERIASLLLTLSGRSMRRTLSAADVRLPRARHDVGNYLGLAVETVSRVFTRSQHIGYNPVRGRQVTSNVLEALQQGLRPDTPWINPTSANS